jgi:hypothetical protein
MVIPVAERDGAADVDRKLPPIAEIAVAIIALVVAGGIDVAAYLPRRAPLAFPIVLAVAAGLLLIWNVVSLSRIAEFAWATFFLVGKWAMLAYLIIAGMLEYVFILDHTRGSYLALLTVMLAIFAVNVPMLLAFSVARYQPAQPRSNKA